ERDHAVVVLREHHPIDIAEQSIESPQAAEDRMNMARHPTDTDTERGMGVDTEGFVVRQESDPTGEPAQYYDERVPHSSGLGAVVSEAMDADNVRPSAQPMDTRTHRAAM